MFPFLMLRVPDDLDVEYVVRRAQEHAGLKDDVIALLLGISRPRWAQIRGGDGPNLTQLGRLMQDPDGAVMVGQIVAALGLDAAALEVLRTWIHRIIADFTTTQMKLNVKPRMAKAQLPETAREKRTA